MIPGTVAGMGTYLSAATVLFMGWFGPRGLASIVLGLVFLGYDIHVPEEETIKLAVMVTVMLSMFAHGFHALPGIALYTRKVAMFAGPHLPKTGHNLTPWSYFWSDLLWVTVHKRFCYVVVSCHT